jgi:hypothetical protein
MNARNSAACLALAVALLSGCGGKTLDDRYAAYSGKSVNGVRAFVDLLRRDGLQVRVMPTVPKSDAHGCKALVVFHDEFGAFPTESREALERRLREGDVDTIALVIRDSDEAPRYWEEALKLLPESTPPEHRNRVARALAEAKSGFHGETASSVPREAGSWYGLKRPSQGGTIRATETTDLYGLLEDLDARADGFRLEFRRALELPPGSRPMLQTPAGPLLVQAPIGADHHVLIAANASFLLNGSLVHKQNRALALAFGRSLDSRTVGVVLSSRLGADDEGPSVWKLFLTQPVPWIVGHLFAALALYCWTRFPVFGRPREDRKSDERRFGRHVEALGDLFMHPAHREFAIEKIETWRQGQARTQQQKE